MNELTSIFDRDALKLLLQMRDLLEEILETIDILADKELMDAIAESEKEIKEGKTRDFREFIKELGLWALRSVFVLGWAQQHLTILASYKIETSFLEFYFS